MASITKGFVLLMVKGDGEPSSVIISFFNNSLTVSTSAASAFFIFSRNPDIISEAAFVPTSDIINVSSSSSSAASSIFLPVKICSTFSTNACLVFVSFSFNLSKKPINPPVSLSIVKT